MSSGGGSAGVMLGDAKTEDPRRWGGVGGGTTVGPQAQGGKGRSQPRESGEKAAGVATAARGASRTGGPGRRRAGPGKAGDPAKPGSS